MDCDYQAVSAQLHEEEAIRDAFIGGIISNEIGQRLLEDSNLTLQVVFEKARFLDTPQRNAESYRFLISSAVHIAKVQSCADDKNWEEMNCSHSGDYRTATAERCMFCGNIQDPRRFCSTKNKIYFKCFKRGHFSRMCRFIQVFIKNETNTIASLMGLSTTCISHFKVNIQVLIKSCRSKCSSRYKLQPESL